MFCERLTCYNLFMLEGFNHSNVHESDIERGVESHEAIFTPEYYKRKKNTILRHIEEVTEVIMSRLLEISNEKYRKIEQDDSADALDLKASLVRAHPFSTTWEQLEESKPEEDLQGLADQRNKKLDEYMNFLEDLSAGRVAGLTVLHRGSQDFIQTNNFDVVDVKYRINIKVDVYDSVYDFMVKIASSFKEDSNLIAGGFQIKTLNEDARDAIIIYLPESSFPMAAKHIIDLFKDNEGYNDRHSDKGIMFGVPLEYEEGGKLPGIRVTEEPAGNYNYSTFNTMQADILSKAVILYIHDVYKGDKTKACEDLGDLESDGRIKWEQDFPSYYARAAKDLVGEGANLDNIAFLSTGK